MALQMADYTNTDREGPPMHRHPRDEAQIVASGYAEFRIGDDDWVGGGSGTVLVRATAALFAEGASLERVAAAAADHGVTLG